jgi:hypothetical protein
LSLSITIAVAVLALLCAAINLLEMSRDAWRRTGFGLLLLVVFLIFLNVTTGFPRPAHGALSPHESVAVFVLVITMAIGIVIGMIVQYAWAQPARFDFLDFVRPLVISPLVLLPLIDSLTASPPKAIQILLLGVLAFQNGFFWQHVLKSAKPGRASSSGPIEYPIYAEGINRSTSRTQ